MRGTRVVRAGWESFVGWYNRRLTEQERVLLHDLGDFLCLDSRFIVSTCI